MISNFKTLFKYYKNIGISSANYMNYDYLRLYLIYFNSNFLTAKSLNQNQTSRFCSARKIDDASNIIAKTNSALYIHRAENNENPPEIPEDLLYQSNSDKLTKCAFNLAKELKDIKKSTNIDENTMFSKIYHSNPKFPEDFQEYIPQSDQSMSIFSYISRNHPEIIWANPNALANNIIYVIYVLSPNSPSSTTKSKLQFCILALATNTISEFLSKVICPMCKISESVRKEHNKLRKIQFQGIPIYDFGSNFSQKLGDLITELNSPITYTSRGGCMHHILAVAAYSVKAENTESFPCIMKTVGSSPSLCSKCGVSTCKFAFKPDNDEIIQLLCQKCSSNYDQNRLISLEGTFF